MSNYKYDILSIMANKFKRVLKQIKEGENILYTYSITRHADHPTNLLEKVVKLLDFVLGIL